MAGRRASDDLLRTLNDGTERPARLADQVYRQLRRSILQGEIAPGANLPGEIKLARVFQVSRPVVREAIGRLRTDGLVASRRGSGTYVAETVPEMEENVEPPEALDLAAVRDALAELEFRMVIEAETAYLAAQRRGQDDLKAMEEALDAFAAALEEGRVARHFDRMFHRAIAEATGNARFVVALDALESERSPAELLMRHRLHFHPRDRGRAVLAEHRDILRLIRDQDSEGARRAMRNHLERARIRMIGYGPNG
ncbi:FadR/GntR family transcriptional regulator [Amorphus sp. 3PC139-8]|uniref:FadR/GntR family transcriptional regulator n=1 Tax=Amorphus sp. 3PC139-8 TaxID=2735676 RepID=UPI00345D6B24